MSQIVKVSALLLGSALLMFAGGLHGLLLATRGSAEGFSIASLALLGTTWSVGYIAGTLLVPKLVRRVGHIRSFSVMASLASTAILLNLAVIDEVAWVILRAMSGFCFAGAAMIVESWLNEVTDNERRGTVFSSYMMANLVFTTAGQMVISVTGILGYLPFILGAIAYSLALLPTATTASPQPLPLTQAKLNMRLLYDTSPVAVIAAFTVGIANGIFGTLAPVYGIQTGLDSATVAYLMSLSLVVGALGQIPIGRISDRMDRRIVIVATGVVAALAGGLMVAFNPGEQWAIFLLFGVYGLAANTIYPVAVAHANDKVTDNDFARVASGLLLLFGSGLAVGPLIAAAVMSALGPVTLFLVTAVFHAALAALAFLRIRTSDATSAADRSPFRYMGQSRTTTPETYALDPRSDIEPEGNGSDTVPPDAEREPAA